MFVKIYRHAVLSANYHSFLSPLNVSFHGTKGKLPSGRCHYLCIKKGVRLESQETCILLSVPQLRKPSMKYLLWVRYHARHWTQAVLPGLSVSPEYTYYKERRWGNSSASMVGRGWPIQLLKQQQRMDTQSASLWQSEYERPWNCGSGVLALAGLSLHESCTDHWTLSKGLWGARGGIEKLRQITFILILYACFILPASGSQ